MNSQHNPIQSGISAFSLSLNIDFFHFITINSLIDTLIKQFFSISSTIGVKHSSHKFLFSKDKSSSELNVPVHIDYFNYRLKLIRNIRSDTTQAETHL